MNSFESIYVSNCNKTGETQDHILIYRELDNVWNWINNHELKSELLSSLDDKKIVMTIPVKLWNGPKYFYDAKSDTGEKLYFLDPHTDKYRIMILNKLGENENLKIVQYFGSKCNYILWKLKRLEKRYNLKSWTAYINSYSMQKIE